MHARLSPFILVSASKCIGCRVCELACSAAHQRGGVSVGSLQVPLSPRLYLTSVNNVRVPIGCRHCEDAPCAEVCPNNAIIHTTEGVQVEEDRCVGCKTCLAVCPVGAMEMAQVWKRGKPAMRRVVDPSAPGGVRYEPASLASKCDLCRGREGGPACVDACPEKALTLVDPIEVKRRRNFEAALALSRTYEEV
ncbi:4Fe-4S dicluster domain-containing protein [Pseudodesulfovibrio thermohalotolerans]|uniref:4Fe-4S dicluster domain-containing protein n=1 Tax=Pseudodesulfovibrio thermohalotolerans TaxID=2880651 RepID=UPI0022B9DF57|nr:4Fe-4S dicluster domain-containing protein [Pseudodesulfovibrio thermohalotolerans]WFS63102.1 4Fe-4S dicluster domain-containing protein [Pseudodesulfovibrio thermohalotolerans]